MASNSDARSEGVILRLSGSAPAGAGSTLPSPLNNRFTGACLWLSFGAISIILSGLVVEPVHAARALAGALLVFGVWAFLYHGGPHVTAAGLFSGASGAFIGYAGLWWAQRLGSALPIEMFWAIVGSYFSTIMMFYGFWWRTRVAKSIPLSGRDPHTARWAVALGSWLVAFGLLSYPIVLQSLRPASRGLAFIGIVLIAIGLLGTHARRRFSSWRLTLVGGLIVAYIAIAFTGFGRLPVIALFSSVAICASIYFRTRLPKIAAVLLVPIVVFFLSTLRSQRLRPRFGITGNRDTPDSSVSGLETFSRLIAHGADLEFGLGETFWATSVIWVPRSLWEGKPFGFGFDLTLLLEPHLASAGHSMVASIFGEWYYNFGWIGLVLCVFFVGFFVRILDRYRERLLTSSLSGRRNMLLAVLLVSVVASMPDFVWSGSFTLADRTLYRAIVVMALLVVFGYGDSRRFPLRDKER